MGAALYEAAAIEPVPLIGCRVYAPVGNHEDLLPYLVRRLLENGSNTSFVNRIADSSAPIVQLIVDPVETVRTKLGQRPISIPLPRDLFRDERENSRGIDLSDHAELRRLASAMARSGDRWKCRVPRSIRG